MKRKFFIAITVLMWIPLAAYLVLGGSPKKQPMGAIHHPKNPGPNVWTKYQRPQWLDLYPQANEGTLKKIEHQFTYELHTYHFQSITANQSLAPYEHNSFTIRGLDWRNLSRKSQEELLRRFSHYFETKGFEDKVAAYPFSSHSGTYKFDVTKPLATYSKEHGFKFLQ